MERFQKFKEECLIFGVEGSQVCAELDLEHKLEGCDALPSLKLVATHAGSAAETVALACGAGRSAGHALTHASDNNLGGQSVATGAGHTVGGAGASGAAGWAGAAELGGVDIVSRHAAEASSLRRRGATSAVGCSTVQASSLV